MHANTRNAVFCLIFLAVASFAGCMPSAAMRFTIQGDDPGSEKLIENLSSESETGESAAILDYGWALWLLRNDSSQAIEKWSAIDERSGHATDAAMARGLAHYFRGEIEQAQKDFLFVVSNAPESALAETAAGFLSELYEHSGSFVTFVKPAYEKLLDDPRSGMRLRLSITETLASIYREAGRRDLEENMKKRLGFFTKTSVYGPFGKFGLIDFDKVYGPEKPGPLATSYETGGKKLSPVYIDSDSMSVKFSDLSDYGGVYYVTSYIKLEEKAEALFRLSTKDLSSLIIDDRSLMNVEPRTAYPLPLHERALILNPGWHKIVLKIADASTKISYQLQLVGRDGSPIVFEQTGEVAGREIATSGWTSSDQPITAERHWREKTAKKKDIRSLFFSMLAHFQFRDNAEVQSLLERCLAINSRFAPLYVMRAFHVVDDPSIGNNVAADRARSDMLLALELDPAQALAAYQLATDDIDNDKIEEAVTRLKELEKNVPSYYLWAKTLFEIYNDQGWIKEARDALERATAKNGRNLGLLKEHHRFLLSRQLYPEAGKLARRIDSIDGSGRTLSKWYKRRGELDEAQAALFEASMWNKASDSLKSRRARILRMLGRYGEAFDIYEKLSKIPGNETRYVDEMAHLQSLRGNPQEAQALLARASKQDPGDFRLRLSVAFAKGRELFDDEVSDGDAVIADYLADDWKPDSSAVIVLDEYLVRMLPDGSTLGRTHIITQVHTKKAQARFGEVHVPDGAELYNLRVIKADGRVLLPEQFGSKSSVTMPDLDSGDFVEYDYVQATNVDRRLSDGRLFSARFYFRAPQLPTYRSRFSVIEEPSMTVRQVRMNYDLAEPVVELKDGLKITSYRNEKLDSITPEPFMPLDDEIYPIVQVNLPVSWDEIRRVYVQSLSRLRRPSAELRNFLEEHWPEKRNQYDAVEKLYYTIAKVIDGEGHDLRLNRSASRILAAKKGNRLLLLSTLLAIKGIESEFVLARPQNITPFEYPDGNFKVYTEALLKVNLRDGRELFLEADYRESVFNRPSPLLSGVRAMLLSESEETFIRLPVWTTLGDSKQVGLYVKLSEDGSAECEGIERIDGYYSVNLRRYIKKLPADRIPKFFEMILNRNFPGTGIKEMDVRNLHDPSKPLELAYTFHVRQLARPVGRHLRIENGFFPAEFSKNYIRTPTRNFPFLINSVNSGYNSTLLELPEGFGVEQAPKTDAVESEFGSYYFSTELLNGRLLMIRSFAIPVQRIDPGKYMDFYRFCNSMDRFEDSGIILKRNLQAAAGLNEEKAR